MTILYTPTNEQLKDLAQQNPEMLAHLNQEIIASLKDKARQYINKNLEQTAFQAYHNLYRKIEGQYFDRNYPRNLTPHLEKMITKTLEKKIENAILTEVEDYTQSEAFLKTVRFAIKNRLTELVLASLDEQLKEQVAEITKI